MAKAAFNNNKNLFTTRLNLHVTKELAKCYILSTALCGARDWTLRKQTGSTWKVLKCGAGEGSRGTFGPIV
jgi:hypothetical protein